MIPKLYRFKHAGALSLVLLLTACALLPSGEREVGLAGRVVEHQLDNGLLLLMVERRQAPVVALTIAFRVGGVNEVPGSTGVAHLYEHLAFKGSKTIGTTDYLAEARSLKKLDEAWGRLRGEQVKGDFADPKQLARLERRFRELQEKSRAYVIPNEMSELYERNGGVGLNASTGKDFTRYVVSLPSNRLELWAAVESDRMANPVLREFYKEKDVVLEERRLRYENSPDGRLYEAFIAAAFTVHPYRMPVIGWTEDLHNLSRSGTEEFFRTYYGPGNAVIAIAGDINIEDTILLIESYFGSIPVQPAPPAVDEVEPPQTEERRVEVVFDAEPSLIIGYHKPAMDHPYEAVFDVIDSLLSSGRTSRLYTSLVKKKALALTVSSGTGVPGSRYPHLFIIEAKPRSPHSTLDLEKAIEIELDRLKNEPVQPKELEKILNRLDASLIRSLESNSGLVSQLSYFQTTAGDWRYLQNLRNQMAHVKPIDIQRVARKYFTKNNRVVATLIKKGKEEARP